MAMLLKKSYSTVKTPSEDSSLKAFWLFGRRPKVRRAGEVRRRFEGTVNRLTPSPSGVDVSGGLDRSRRVPVRAVALRPIER
jgi:hypothetical protein